MHGTARRTADLTYAGNRAMVIYRLPLNEVVFDFAIDKNQSPAVMQVLITHWIPTAR